MSPDLFWPAFAQVALLFVLGCLTAFVRFRAVLTGEVAREKVSLGERNWPDFTQRVSNVFNNQWESPTYFLAAIVAAALLGVQGGAIATLAWVFVATRLIHAGIYLTINIVPIRFLFFLTGFLATTAIWALLALRVAGG